MDCMNYMRPYPGILDCIVLPSFKRRGVALNDRFPSNRVSLRSTAVALDTFIGELGIAEHDGYDQIVNIMMVVTRD